MVKGETLSGRPGKGPGHLCPCDAPPVAQPNCPEPVLFSKVVTGHRRLSSHMGEHSPSRRLWWLGSLVSVPPWTRLQSDDDIQLFLPSPLLSSVLQIQQVLPMGRHCPRPELWPLPRLMLWSWLAVACPQVPVGWADLGPHLHWLYSQASLQDHM